MGCVSTETVALALFLLDGLREFFMTYDKSGKRYETILNTVLNKLSSASNEQE